MRALVIAASLLVTACGAVERAFIDGLLQVQSRAVLTQSTFKPDHPERRHKPCDRIRVTRTTPSFRAAQTARNLGGGESRPPRSLALCRARNRANVTL